MSHFLWDKDFSRNTLSKIIQSQVMNVWQLVKNSSVSFLSNSYSVFSSRYVCFDTRIRCED